MPAHRETGISFLALGREEVGSPGCTGEYAAAADSAVWEKLSGKVLNPGHPAEDCTRLNRSPGGLSFLQVSCWKVRPGAGGQVSLLPGAGGGRWKCGKEMLSDSAGLVGRPELALTGWERWGPGISVSRNSPWSMEPRSHGPAQLPERKHPDHRGPRDGRSIPWPTAPQWGSQHLEAPDTA